MLIKSQLYCLLIRRPLNGTRGEICTPNLVTLDQVPLLIGLRERKLAVTTGNEGDSPQNYRGDESRLGWLANFLTLKAA
jgi:hypothetical protein